MCWSTLCGRRKLRLSSPYILDSAAEQVTTVLCPGCRNCDCGCISCNFFYRRLGEAGASCCNVVSNMGRMWALSFGISYLGHVRSIEPFWSLRALEWPGGKKKKSGKRVPSVVLLILAEFFLLWGTSTAAMHGIIRVRLRSCVLQ